MTTQTELRARPTSQPGAKQPDKHVGRRTSGAPAPMQAHKGMFYELQVREVPGRGFTAEAVILQDSGDWWNLCDMVGSADALLDSREAAEEIATQLAREWIESNG